MKKFIKKKWKVIVAVIDIVYNTAICLPFYLMTFPCLSQHAWSPIFFEILYLAYFWGMYKIDRYTLDLLHD
jgi:hypothetical protein